MTPAPAARLPVLRVLVGGFAVAYLVLRFGHFWDLAALPATRWEPVGILGPLEQPIAPAVSRALLVGAVASGLAFVTGWRYRLAAPMFAALLLVVLTARNSWGQVWHTENLVVWHVGILACAPAGPRARRDDCSWVPFLMSLVTVTTYLLAGVTKLRDAGVDWLAGDALRNHVAYDNVRKAVLGAESSPIAGAVLDHAWVFVPLAWITLAVELGAPVALLGRAWARAWAVAAWLFHVGVLALMAISFPYQLTGIAFASLFPVERLADWRRGDRRRLLARAPGRPATGAAVRGRHVDTP